MLCDKCHQNPANVHFTQIINGQKTEMNLCASCAAQENLSIPFTPFPHSLFSEVQKNPQAPQVSCPGCHLTWQEFHQTGRLGCAQCADAFAALLAPSLRQIHGAGAHTGKAPAYVNNVKNVKNAENAEENQRTQNVPEEKTQAETLKQALAEAVKAENYEQAAVIRDQIKALEAGGPQKEA